MEGEELCVLGVPNGCFTFDPRLRKCLYIIVVPLQSLDAHVNILKTSSHEQHKAVQPSLLVQLLHLIDKFSFYILNFKLNY